MFGVFFYYILTLVFLYIYGEVVILAVPSSPVYNTKDNPKCCFRNGQLWLLMEGRKRFRMILVYSLRPFSAKSARRIYMVPFWCISLCFLSFRFFLFAAHLCWRYRRFYFNTIIYQLLPFGCSVCMVTTVFWAIIRNKFLLT